MKQAKERVIALDYFRGIFILMVVINHAAIFSMPLAYLTGAGRLWTSAAEMFLMICGVTLWIVRSDTIKSDFKATTLKIWRRAAITYGLYLITIFMSLGLFYFFIQNGIPNTVPGDPVHGSAISMVLQLATFSHVVGVTTINDGFGWATFFAYYAIFLCLAPFVLYGMRTRLWYLVPAGSIAVFVLNSSVMPTDSLKSSLAIWQVYLVIGLVIGRLRRPLIGWFYGLNKKISSKITATILTTTAAVSGVCILLDFNLYSRVYALAASGWVPIKLQLGYMHLLNHKVVFDHLFLDLRTGVLRPLVSVLFLATIYLLYQKHKTWLLNKTGRFVKSMGGDSMWIFVGQAIAIPIIAALPFPRNLLMNTILTSFLVLLMWSITKRRAVARIYLAYLDELKSSYRQAKNNYIYGPENNS